MLKKAVLFLLLCIPIFAYSISIDEALFTLAENLYEQGKYEQAITQFKNLMVRHPDTEHYTEALYYTAKSLYSESDFDEAQYYYELFASRADTETQQRQALFGLGQCAYHLHNWVDAADFFTQFANSYPDSPVASAALYYGGLSYYYQSEIDSAEIMFNHLVIYYPASAYYENTLDKLITLKNNTIVTTTTIEKDESTDSSDNENLPTLSTEEEQETLTGSTAPGSVVYNIYTTPDEAATYFPLNEVDLFTGTIPTNHSNRTIIRTTNNEETDINTDQNTTEKTTDNKPPWNENTPSVSETIADDTTTEVTMKTIVVTNYLSIAKTNMVFMTNRQKPAKLYFTNKTLITNTIKITNYFQATNLSLLTQMVLLTNLSMFTQHVMFTNLAMLTQMVLVLDSNTIFIDEQLEENTQVEEEIDRLRSLTEIKAKLLNMKELALEQKEELIRQTNYLSGNKK